MLIHNELSNFWFCSIGVWDSLLVTVTVDWVDEPELLSIGKIHKLDRPEFGVRMSWQYKKKSQSGYMSWCVDTQHPNLVFTNKGLTNDNPCVLNYQMLNVNKLVITVDKLEETFVLEGERRLRELRYDGKLIRRLWEKKVMLRSDNSQFAPHNSQLHNRCFHVSSYN